MEKAVCKTVQHNPDYYLFKVVFKMSRKLLLFLYDIFNFFILSEIFASFLHVFLLLEKNDFLNTDIKKLKVRQVIRRGEFSV